MEPRALSLLPSHRPCTHYQNRKAVYITLAKAGGAPRMSSAADERRAVSDWVDQQRLSSTITAVLLRFGILRRRDMSPGTGGEPVPGESVTRPADVLGDLAQQDRRDIATAVVRNGRGAAIRMAKLLVRATLADFATTTACVPTNSVSSFGSPSSSSIAITSLRLACSSSRVAPWLCAPGNPVRTPRTGSCRGSVQLRRYRGA